MRLTVAMASVLLACSGAISDGVGAQQASAPPDISGFWELRYNSRHVTPASVKPEVAAQIKQEQAEARKSVLGAIGYDSIWCLKKEYPFFMGSSPPIDIVQTPEAVVVMSEGSNKRHFYMDGRGHPDPALLQRTTTGHAIGRWEGDTLVVDTVGLRGGENVNGGGRTTETTHLVERYRLLANGEQLQVTFTWDDPAVFLKPHTYDFVYYRDPPGTYAFEGSCDASDPANRQSTVEPKQAGNKK